ncbi:MULTISPECIES: isochorismatase family protein [unclassified Beijerinckia]|uniref:isochorismatase family protein n=1 Tax=unclassified Beijerinckia TaxID=2638183 RepID=UPI001AECFA8A|nr:MULTISPECIES: isochorismatase family protein [unclassified Beijerinckia]
MFAASGYGALAGYGKRPALLIIDVNYGFCGDKPEPILQSITRWSNSCGAESWEAIAHIASLADLFRAKRMPVIFTTGHIRPDNWDAGGWAWKNARSCEAVPHRKMALDPNAIVAELKPEPQDIVVHKQKPSAFFGTDLMSYLNLLGCDSVIVTGTTTSGCVRATVIDAFSYNIRVTIAEDGCFDRSQASHALSLCDMHAKYADVMPIADVQKHIATLSDDLFPNLPKT